MQELNQLQSEYDTLQDKYSDISHKLEGSVKPPYMVVEGRNFTVKYKTLEGKRRILVYQLIFYIFTPITVITIMVS